MDRDFPLVLIASASAYERGMVESTLKQTGLTTVAVDDADDAARELTSDGAPGILVIDSGLLDAPHDAQWRRLRMRHPGLYAAVRCLIPGDESGRRLDEKTLLVHPDDDQGLRDAIAMLAAEAGEALDPAIVSVALAAR